MVDKIGRLQRVALSFASEPQDTAGDTDGMRRASPSPSGKGGRRREPIHFLTVTEVAEIST